MEYIIVGFLCLIIGYGIGIAHHVCELEDEIKLRKEWECAVKSIVQAAAGRYGVVAPRIIANVSGN